MTSTPPDRPGHVLSLPAPAASFNDAFLLGNGSLGAAVRGGIGTEHVGLNADTFWSGGPDTAEAEPTGSAARLEAVRAAVRARDWSRADLLAERLQGTRWAESYQPVGTVRWRYTDLADTAGYRRRLHLRDGVASSVYGRREDGAELTVFVADEPSVVVLHATGRVSTDDPVFDCPHPHDDLEVVAADGTAVSTWAGRAPARVLPNYLGDVPDAITYADDAPDDRGTVARGMGFAVAARRVPDGHGGAYVVIAVEDGFRGRTARPSADLAGLRLRAVERVAAGAERVDRLLEEHRGRRRALIDTFDLELHGDADAGIAPTDVERYLHLGRHLLVSSSRPGSQPANLQGIWNEDVRPGWSCDWTTNINVQMNYWGARLCGLGATAEPLVDLIEDLVAPGSRTARSVYGARGWAVHHNVDLWGLTTAVPGLTVADTAYANWPVGGLWLVCQAAASLDHLAQGSPEFERLRQRITPLLAGGAAFALDLVEDDGTGRLWTNPSTSPEHRFIGADGLPHAVSAGTTLDQELVRETLERVLELAPEHALAPEARAALGRLRRPALGPDGLLLEWSDPRPSEEPGHRHVSHLYGLFPGRSITQDRDPRAYDGARGALEDRLANGGGGTGWSQAWVLCLAARLGDASLVRRSVEVLLSQLASRSLLDLHPDQGHPLGQRFQIDGNLGGIAGILGALIDSDPDTIRVLPACPAEWRSGALRGAIVAGGHLVDLRWNERDGVVLTVTAAGPGRRRIVVAAGEGDVETEVTGGSVARGGDGTMLEWAFDAGAVLVARSRR